MQILYCKLWDGFSINSKKRSSEIFWDYCIIILSEVQELRYENLFYTIFQDSVCIEGIVRVAGSTPTNPWVFFHQIVKSHLTWLNF